MFGSAPSKRHRHTVTANRSRFAEIFALGTPAAAEAIDKMSSDTGFAHQVFPTPLFEEEGDEEVTSPVLKKADFLNGGINVSKLIKQESTDLRSPSP